MNETKYHKSALGAPCMIPKGEEITGSSFVNRHGNMVVDKGTILFGEYYSPIVKKCSSQLDEYFAGARTIFDSNLLTSGMDFLQVVWAQLQNNGYGKTLS